MIFENYEPGKYYDEYFNSDGKPRDNCLPVINEFNNQSLSSLKKLKKYIDVALTQIGITFNVANHKDGLEKIFPFDVIPRIISNAEWVSLEKGLKQRIEALDCFVADVYGSQHIIKDKVVPKDLILSSKSYLPICHEIEPPLNRWIHISGIDIIKDIEGLNYILEDNFRCPSGVSYVLENRSIMKQSIPNFFQKLGVMPVTDYPEMLLDTLQSLAPQIEDPNIVLLTPGVYNSAYFEHSYLARQMGIQLVEGRDMVVEDEHVYIKTTLGLEKVDIIYRRIDDEYLDPTALKKDSLLGVPGLIDCYAKGNVAIANAPGTGIADDKAIYAYVPSIIEYYLKESPILPNVPTYLMSDEKERKYTFENLDNMVVKPTNASGGYGIYIGPHENDEIRSKITQQVLSSPRDFIAQPKMLLSRMPTLFGAHAEGRHIDLRPYILYGKDVYVLPGGLTRVALNKESLIVNSSQGGGSKDTWVMME